MPYCGVTLLSYLLLPFLGLLVALFDRNPVLLLLQPLDWRNCRRNEQARPEPLSLGNARPTGQTLAQAGRC